LSLGDISLNRSSAHQQKMLAQHTKAENGDHNSS